MELSFYKENYIDSDYLGESIIICSNYISLWDCKKGEPLTKPNYPDVNPFTYSNGDYYIVSKVGLKNYRPCGIWYNDLKSEELSEVKVGDMYLFDGKTWKLVKRNDNTKNTCVLYNFIPCCSCKNGCVKRCKDGIVIICNGKIKNSYTYDELFNDVNFSCENWENKFDTLYS